MLRGSQSLASAAITCGPAGPNPSRASTWPSVSALLNFFSTESSCASPSSSAGGANGIWNAACGGAGARARSGSGGGANGI